MWMRVEGLRNTHPMRWGGHLHIIRLVSIPKILEAWLTLLGRMERMSALVDGLSRELAQQDARFSGLEYKIGYIMSHLGEIDDRLDSLGIKKEVLSAKRERNEDEDEDEDEDELAQTARDTVTATKRKKARFARDGVGGNRK